MPRVQGRTGGACGRTPRGSPRTQTGLSGFAQGPFSPPLSLLRSKAQGLPCVARPFDGMTVHWTVIFVRLTPVPWANLLSRPTSEEALVFGAQSPGCLFFRFLALGKQRKEPVVRGWVSRQKASVRWTLGPANGLATDGKPRTCKREHGERSAASPLINNRRVGDTNR